MNNEELNWEWIKAIFYVICFIFLGFLIGSIGRWTALESSPPTEIKDSTTIETYNNEITAQRQKFLCEKAGGKIKKTVYGAETNIVNCVYKNQCYKWENDNWSREEILK